MASSYAHMPKTHHHGSRNLKFAESSARTMVGLHKTEVKFKKMADSLERQQNTAVNNIANHQQAMKMSWRRLEERRAASPLMNKREKQEKDENAKAKKGMMLQSNTRLYVKGTPQVYDIEQSEESELFQNQTRPVTADDSFLGRPPSATRSYVIHGNKLGPPPTQLTRAQTSPYITSPYNFRKSLAAKPQLQSEQTSASETELGSSQSQDSLKSSSQPMVIKSSAINSKETLLKASTLMDISSHSSGPRGFKNFYSADKHRGQSHTALPVSPLASKQVGSADLGDEENSEELNEDEVGASSSMPSLAEQFEQIKNCRYIRHSRHYHPEEAALDND